MNQQEFLKLFSYKVDRTQFYAADDEKGKPDHSDRGFKSNIFNGDLKKLNDQGFGIFFAVNKFKNGERIKSKVQRVRAVWIEDDTSGKLRDDFPLPPSIIINSSPNKYHYYWLTRTNKFEEFDRVMQTMVDKYHCDPNARDISRILRLPDTYHCKGKKRHRVKVVGGNFKKYKWEMIKIAFPPAKKKKSTYSNESGDFSIDKAVQSLTSTKNMHGSMISLALSCVNQNISKKMFKQMMHLAQSNIDFDACDKKRQDEITSRFSEEHLDESYDSAIKKKESENKPSKKITNFDWTEEFTVSKKEAEKYDDPTWLSPNLIIGGHVIAIPAPPNGGKTTLFLHIAKQLAEQGLMVFYVNADIGQSDAKSMVRQAGEGGFKLLLPDMKEGLSMADVVNSLEAMNETGGDFSKHIFIFDTLKKMTDVISKNKSKNLYKLLRGLSSKGMTIVLLAHTNKYKDKDGHYIFEGTGDLRADVDELIYLIPKFHDDGSMTVSTKPDKVRGKFKPISFKITPELKVISLSDFVDLELINKNSKQREKDTVVIMLITEAIESGNTSTIRIKKHIQESGAGIGWRTVNQVLERYTDKLWKFERSLRNNAKKYILINDSTGTSGTGGSTGGSQNV